MQDLVRQPVPPRTRLNLSTLLSAIEEIAPFKGPGVECHIDSPGEPLLYSRLPELVKALKSTDPVTVVSLQTNGTLLDDIKITVSCKSRPRSGQSFASCSGPDACP